MPTPSGTEAGAFGPKMRTLSKFSRQVAWPLALGTCALAVLLAGALAMAAPQAPAAPAPKAAAKGPATATAVKKDDAF